MVIDTSALVAVLLGEPEASRMVRAITEAATRVVGAPSIVETTAVLLARVGPEVDLALNALTDRLDIHVEPMSVEAARFARLAYARYGRGVGSPGVLNFGDCLAYGVAQSLGEPLLFKGTDFSATDVAVVAY